MLKKMIIYGISASLLLLIVIMPLCLHALDTGGKDIAVLDPQTFIVTKEFAGEIKLYLCTIQDGRILIRDSTSIPYMVMEHRDLRKPGNNEISAGNGNDEPPIIKIVP